MEEKINYMNFDYLVDTEHSVLKETLKDRYYWLDKFPDLLNSLFECSYFTRTKWDDYGTFANALFDNSIYTLQAIEILTIRGYYLESSTLIRTLFEVFAKLRYFKKYPELCLDYSLKKVKVQFKKMFEEFSPGLYDILYKQLLSEFAHGGVGANIFHNKLITQPMSIQPIQGCYYDEGYSNLTINAMTQLFYGYLNIIPNIFDEYNEKVKEEVEKRRVENIKWLEDRFNDQMVNHPKVKEFYELLFPLIKF